MTGESTIFSGLSSASASRDFTTHNSDRILVRVVPSSGQTCNVTIRGTATSAETDAGTEIDSKTGVDDKGFLVSLENMPVYKITVEYDTLSGGTVSGYVFVGGV